MVVELVHRHLTRAEEIMPHPLGSPGPHLARLLPRPAACLRHFVPTLIALSALTSASPALAQGTPSTVGRWSDAFLTKNSDASAGQFGAVHMLLLYGGSPSSFKVSAFYNDVVNVWDYQVADPPCSTCSFPLAGRKYASTSVFPPTVSRGLFCTSHAQQCDGKMVFAGAELDYPDEGTASTLLLDARSSTPTLNQAADMALPRYYGELTELGNGKLLVTSGTQHDVGFMFGGANASGPWGDWNSIGIHKNPLWTTANDADSFRVTPPEAPAPREGHSLVPDPAGWARVAIWGGHSGTTVYDDGIWILGTDDRRDFAYYGDVMHSWRHRVITGTRPAARYDHTAVMTPNRQMIVFGGRDNTTVFNDVWILDLDNSPLDGLNSIVWNAMSIDATNGAPAPRSGHSAVFVGKVDAVRDINGNILYYEANAADPPRVFIMGGRNAAGDALSDTWELRLSRDTSNGNRWKGTWYTRQSMPTASAGHTAVPRALTSGYEILVFGGENGTLPTRTLLGATSVFRKYTPDVSGAGTWAAISATGAPSPRSGHAATYYPNGDVMLLFGGLTSLASPGTTDYSKELWTYTVNTATWTQSTASIPESARRAGGKLVLGGYSAAARYPEVFDPDATTPGGPGITLYGSWAKFHPDAHRWQPSYNYMHLLPDGRVLYAGPAESTFVLNPQTTVASPWRSIPNSGYGSRYSGNSVEYRPGSIVRFGGVDAAGPQGKTDWIKIGVPDSTAGWQQLGDDPTNKRQDHHMTLAPTGDVILTGGWWDRSTAGEQRAARVWNVATQTWSSELAPEPMRRIHHSSAILLPDGRVMSGGGDQPRYGTDPSHDNQGVTADIYEPPYLFDPTGGGANYATRPVITSAPAQIRCGTSFTIGAANPSDIHTVCLIKPSAVTHDVNMDQRYVPLSFTVSGGALQVTAPANTHTAPPGYYLLFIVRKDPLDATKARTPSIAQWVQVVGNTGGNWVSVGAGCTNHLFVSFGSPPDAIQGAPIGYLVKASLTPITEANFDGATETVFDGAPTNGGQIETMLWSAPLDCTRYYFAIRATYGGCSSTLVSASPSGKPVCTEFCDDGGSLPSKFMPTRLTLAPPAPNPAESDVRIFFGIPRASEGVPYDVSLFDIAGRRVATLESGIAKAGYHSVAWNPAKAGGARLAGGHYYVRLRQGDTNLTRSLVLVR